MKKNQAITKSPKSASKKLSSDIRFWLFIVGALILITGANLFLQKRSAARVAEIEKEGQTKRDMILTEYAKNEKTTLEQIMELSKKKVEQGQAGDAIAILKEGVGRFPNVRDAYLLLAQSYLLENQPKLAVAAATRAQEIDPVSSKVTDILSSAQKTAGDSSGVAQTEARGKELKKMGL